MRSDLRCFLMVSALTVAGCGWPWGGPSGSVTGTWQAPGIGHGTNFYRLTLSQDGDEVSGTACGVSLPFRWFTDVAVTGDYPHVRFVDPNGALFSGKFEEDRDQIAGDYGPSRIPLRFVRSNTGRCDEIPLRP